MSTTLQGNAEQQYLSHAPQPQYHEGTAQQHQMHPQPVSDVLHDGSHYKAAGKLVGKKALITGGDSGIGRSVALLFALEGADLTIQYLPEEAEDARNLVAEIQKRAPRANVLPLSLDLSERSACEALVQKHLEFHGSLNTLVLNHGIQHVQKDIEELSPEQWLNTFDVNIHPHFYIVHAALGHLSEGSTITMNASVNHFKGHPLLVDYTATKGAMVGFARALSNAIVGKRGIRVNVVAPGPIWTPLIVATMPKDSQEKFGTSVPMGRPGQPVEVATCFVFLASPDSSYISGQVLHPNGGTVVS
ncbi:hypothetical protein FRB99_007175 [Tulasnella sp. 403]|nr:hypothetical protein FRB99_007175 [Tulasnella sp. 403]